MPKLSQIVTNSSPALADSFVGVTASGTDDLVTLQNLQNLLLANVLATGLKGNFGDGTFRQMVDDGQSHASAGAYFYVGKTLVQYATTTVNIAAINTAYSWSISWPKAFTSVGIAFQTVQGGYSLSRLGDGTFEVLSTTAISGFVENTSATQSVVVLALGIGT